MDILVLINLIANLILTLAFMLFMIFVFGRKNSKIYNLPWYKTIAAKIGLAVCGMGALLNTLTVSNPPASEIMLNVGLACLFTWASVFHYSAFVVPYKQQCMDAPKAKRKVKPRLVAK